MSTYNEDVRSSHKAQDTDLLAFLAENHRFLQANISSMIGDKLCGEAFSHWVGLQAPLVAVLEAHPLFGHPIKTRFGTRGLRHAPGAIASSVLEQAGNLGPVEAVAWLRRIFSCQSTDMVAISVVSGLEVGSDVIFSNGVTIGPAASLPFSKQVQALNNPLRTLENMLQPRWGEADCFAWKRVEAPACEGHIGGFPDEEARQDTLQILTALALDPRAAPTSTSWWSEFVDRDFQILERRGRGVVGQKGDGPEQHLSSPLDKSTPALVDKYLNLTGKFRNKCSAALTGLHLSRRIWSPNSRAIELCIGLEALLGGDANSEIIHKVSTRGAIIIGKTLEERKSIRKQLKDLYNIRSKAVHGDVSRANDSYAVVNEGAGLASTILRTAVSHGREFPLDEIDLMASFSLRGPSKAA